MIKSVIFDLDDTLCPEIEYVKSGFKAVADYFNDPSIYEKLYTLFKVDTKNVYQRAGFDKETCERCIQIYRDHKPNLQLPPETKETLLALKNKGYSLGIITDGRPKGQWNKIHVLKLDSIFNNIIVTDELGGIEYRKPNPKAFQIMSDKMNCSFENMIYIGDNPAKDFTAPKLLGMKTCLFVSKFGLYSSTLNINCDYRINNIAELLTFL